MFCTNCGNKTVEGSVFCNKCGTKFITPTESTYAEPTSTQPSQTTPIPVEPESTVAVPASVASTPTETPKEVYTPKCNICGMNLPAGSKTCYCGNENKAIQSVQSQAATYPKTYGHNKKKKVVIFSIIGALILLVGGIAITTLFGESPQEAMIREYLDDKDNWQWIGPPNSSEVWISIPAEWDNVNFSEELNRIVIHPPPGRMDIVSMTIMVFPTGQSFIERALFEYTLGLDGWRSDSDFFLFDDFTAGLFMIRERGTRFEWAQDGMVVTMIIHADWDYESMDMRLMDAIAGTLRNPNGWSATFATTPQLTHENPYIQQVMNHHLQPMFDDITFGEIIELIFINHEWVQPMEREYGGGRYDERDFSYVNFAGDLILNEQTHQIEFEFTINHIADMVALTDIIIDGVAFQFDQLWSIVDHARHVRDNNDGADSILSQTGFGIDDIGTAGQVTQVIDTSNWITLDTVSGSISIPPTWSYEYGRADSISLNGEGVNGTLFMWVSELTDLWGEYLERIEELLSDAISSQEFTFDDMHIGYMLEFPTHIRWVRYDYFMSLTLLHDGDMSIFTDNEDLILQIARTFVRFDSVGQDATLQPTQQASVVADSPFVGNWQIEEHFSAFELTYSGWQFVVGGYVEFFEDGWGLAGFQDQWHFSFSWREDFDSVVLFYEANESIAIRLYPWFEGNQLFLSQEAGPPLILTRQ